MNSIQDTTDIINKANVKKAQRLEQARKNYQKRKEQGLIKKQLIPREEQKKRGPKTEPETIKPIPKVRGRKPKLINDIADIPEYLNLNKKDIKTAPKSPGTESI